MVALPYSPAPLADANRIAEPPGVFLGLEPVGILVGEVHRIIDAVEQFRRWLEWPISYADLGIADGSGAGVQRAGAARAGRQLYPTCSVLAYP